MGLYVEILIFWGAKCQNLELFQSLYEMFLKSKHYLTYHQDSDCDEWENECDEDFTMSDDEYDDEETLDENEEDEEDEEDDEYESENEEDETAENKKDEISGENEDDVEYESENEGDETVENEKDETVEENEEDETAEEMEEKLEKKNIRDETPYSLHCFGRYLTNILMRENCADVQFRYVPDSGCLVMFIPNSEDHILSCNSGHNCRFVKELNIGEQSEKWPQEMMNACDILNIPRSRGMFLMEADVE
jgi:hypothetical protein